MKILICGDRNWKDWGFISQTLKDFVDEHGIDIETCTIITGGAKGVDHYAHQIALYAGFDTHVEPADWERYGRSAGPIRNRKMLDMKPDYALAFHDDIGNSKGTKDCVKEAFKRGIPVYIYTHENGIARLESCSF